jgi:hypothetical protein
VPVARARHKRSCEAVDDAEIVTIPETHPVAFST